MKNIIITKIGGATLSFDNALRNFHTIIGKITSTNNDSKAIIIVSAIGKTTSMLNEIAQATINNHPDTYLALIETLKKSYIALFSDYPDLDIASRQLINTRFEELIQFADGIATLRELSNRSLDKILSLGEIITAELLDLFLSNTDVNHKYIPANQLIITDSNFGNAKPDFDLFASNFDKSIPNELAKHDVILTQGFIASNAEGHHTTMGYESSNYTAALFAKKVKAKQIDIWTDSKGIRNADPKVFSETCLIPDLSYKQALELAELGLNLIHKDMVTVAKENDIILYYHSASSDDDFTTINHKSNLSKPIVIIKNKVDLLEFSVYNISSLMINDIISDLEDILIDFDARLINTAVLNFRLLQKHKQQAINYLQKAIVI